MSQQPPPPPKQPPMQPLKQPPQQLQQQRPPHPQHPPPPPPQQQAPPQLQQQAPPQLQQEPPPPKQPPMQPLKQPPPQLQQQRPPPPQQPAPPQLQQQPPPQLQQQQPPQLQQQPIKQPIKQKQQESSFIDAGASSFINNKQPTHPVQYRQFNSTANFQRFFLEEGMTADVAISTSYVDTSKLVAISRTALQKCSLLKHYVQLLDGNVANFPLIPVKVHPMIPNEPVITLLGPNCDVATLGNLVSWCEYHANDPKWDPSGWCDDFEMDEYDLEDSRLKEMLCLFDRTFFEQIGPRIQVPNSQVGDSLLSKEYYDLMLLAHYVGCEDLVEAGGKYLCRELDGKSRLEMYKILGLQ